jgi:pimeloyl-ACP methyl ester carboxylesterase
MGRWLRTLLILLVTASIGVGAWLLAVRVGAFEISREELLERYSKPNSKFVDLDGLKVHYTDEGSGPPVVLVHASFMSLHAWDELAAALAQRHRVIRFDMQSCGLTGPDPKQRYSMEHNIALVHALTTALDIDRYALIGTSSGGTVAFNHAAQYPERVTRLVLINSAGMPRTPATDPNRGRGNALSQWITRHHKSRQWWKRSLTQQITGGTAPPASLIDRVYDFNRRRGLVEESAIYLRGFRTGDPEAVLADVRSPTLILWGMGNITVSHLEADVMQLWLTNAPSLKRKYPKLGHYAYIEAPETVATDVDAFLSGAMDGELRVTRRVLAGAAVSNASAPAP